MCRLLLLSTAGQTVLAEGLSGTRAFAWNTLSLTVEVSETKILNICFASEVETQPSDANILQDSGVNYNPFSETWSMGCFILGEKKMAPCCSNHRCGLNSQMSEINFLIG